jgi:hypothetical protein
MAEQTQGTKRRFEEEFKALPLDEKLTSLFRMEAAELEETFHAVADASVKAFHKASEVIDGLGQRMSAEFNKERGAAPGAEKTAEPAAEKPKGAKKKNSKPGPQVNV